MPPGHLLTAEDQAAFATEMKLAFVATRDAEGRPHVALITTLQACGPDRLVFGEFVRGRTKENLAARPEAAWAVLTLDRRLWRGRARWTGAAGSGPEYERLNRLPMFRYNAYFGIHTVHHLDLVEALPGGPLPMARVVPAVLLTRVLRIAAAAAGPRVMSPFTVELFDRLDAVKLLAWVDPEGWPRLVPLLQCQAAGSRRLLFSTLAWGDELRAIPGGTPVAVYAAATTMETVLAGGPLTLGRRGGIPCGWVDVDRVYNSMPPAHGPIHPPEPLEPVTRF